MKCKWSNLTLKTERYATLPNGKHAFLDHNCAVAWILKHDFDSAPELKHQLMMLQKIAPAPERPKGYNQAKYQKMYASQTDDRYTKKLESTTLKRKAPPTKQPQQPPAKKALTVRDISAPHTQTTDFFVRVPQFTASSEINGFTQEIVVDFERGGGFVGALRKFLFPQNRTVACVISERSITVYPYLEVDPAHLEGGRMRMSKVQFGLTERVDQDTNNDRARSATAPLGPMGAPA